MIRVYDMIIKDKFTAYLEGNKAIADYELTAPTVRQINVPSCLIKKENYDDYVLKKIKLLAPFLEPNWRQPYNIIIMTKKIDDNFEVGSCAWDAVTDYPNKKLQKYLDRMRNLKAFW